MSWGAKVDIEKLYEHFNIFLKGLLLSRYNELSFKREKDSEYVLLKKAPLLFGQNFGSTSLFTGRSNFLFETRVAPILSPAVSRGETYPFPGILHLWWRFGIPGFSSRHFELPLSFTHDWLTYN